MSDEPLNLEKIRARLADARGPQYWRSLDELAATAQFRDFLDREFPRQASEWNDPSPVSRRRFLKLMGASLALAGLTGCSFEQPQEQILPYVTKPDPVVPGLPLFFATAMPLGGYATGLLVRSNEGRPTKVEGNPDHPASLGATDVYAQASLLTLYDPDRSQRVTSAGQPRTWEDFLAALNGALTPLRSNGGAGLRILTEASTSPTLAAQMQALLTALPQARWVAYEPAGDSARLGTQQAFGQDVHPVYRFEQGPRGAVARRRCAAVHAGARALCARHRRRALDAGRREHDEPDLRGRVGADDHRGAGRPPAAAARQRRRGVCPRAGAGTGRRGRAGRGARRRARAAGWKGWSRICRPIAGRALLIAGDSQPPAVHALAHAINAALGNTGTTVIYTEPVVTSPIDQAGGLRQLVQEMAGGQVQALLIVGGNPAYSAAADVDFAGALKSVPFSAHLSLYEDETSALTTWHIPRRTTSSPGAMRAPTTARPRSSSR